MLVPIPMSLLRVFLSMAIAAAATGPSSAQEARGIFDQVRAVISTMDEDQLTLAGQARLLGGDADKIVAFVQDEVRVDLYRGSLRGARGALISRSGNPLDQALLLSEMLKAAGYGARLRRVELTAKDLNLLIGQYTSAAAANLSYLYSPSDIARALKLGAGTIETMRQQKDMLRTDVVLSAGKWAKALEPHINRQTPRENLAEMPRALYLVEYRKNGQDWLGANPISGFSTQKAGALAGFDSADLPTDLMARFNLRVLLQVTDQGGRKSEKPLAEVSASSAELYMAPFFLMIAPSDFGALQSVELMNQALDSGKMLFTLNPVRGLAPVTRYFDMSGEISATPFSPAEAIGAANTGGLAGIGGALGGIFGQASPPDEPKSVVTDIIIEYAFGFSRGKPTIIRRSIAQLLGKKALDRGIFWSADINVAAGRVPRQPVALAKLKAVLAYEPALALAVSDAKVSLQDMADVIGTAMKSAALDFTVMAQELEMKKWRRVPQGKPTIIALESVLWRVNGKIRSKNLIDIVNLNTDGLFCARVGCAPSQSSDALEIGVLWTAAEGEFLAGLLDPAKLLPVVLRRKSVTTAGTVLAQALSNGQPRFERVATLNELDGALSGFSAATDPARAAMAQDLQSGSTLVLLADGAAPTTWWRIDPATGLALGTGLEGRGQGVLERLELETSTITTVKALVEFASFISCIYDAGQAVTDGLDGSGNYKTWKFALCLASAYAGAGSLAGAGGPYRGVIEAADFIFDYSGTAIDAYEFYDSPNLGDATGFGLGLADIVF